VANTGSSRSTVMQVSSPAQLEWDRDNGRGPLAWRDAVTLAH
jgi:hypothetical protein